MKGNNEAAPFSLRSDHNGIRPVYNLGNELGDCPWKCTFCSVGRSPRVTSEWNIAEFERQHEQFLQTIDGEYHPLIYNQGNVTNPSEFSRDTLKHILGVFSLDERVKFVSLNSRERHATPNLLEVLAAFDLPFPIHFILGVESFSPRAPRIFGKDTSGELQRYVDKLRPFNERRRGTAPYVFGLDANLVLLPEMYLEDEQTREGNEDAITWGFCTEVSELLARISPSVPVEINLHPYHRVDTLPYQDLQLDSFIDVLPSLQKIVETHNANHPEQATHLFVGVEGSGFDSGVQMQQVKTWRAIIDNFNLTGRLSYPGG